MYRSLEDSLGVDPHTEYYHSRSDTLSKYPFLQPSRYIAPYSSMQDAMLHENIPTHTHPRGLIVENCPLCQQATMKERQVYEPPSLENGERYDFVST